MKNLFSIGLMAIGLLACGSKQMENATAETDAVNSAAAQTEATEIRDLYSDGRGKIIKSAECRFEVKNMKQSMDAIEMSIKKYSAFIAASNLELQNPMLEQQLSIRDRKSTRLNSSHRCISYAVFCL